MRSYCPDVYRPRITSFAVQEEKRVATETGPKQVLVGRWLSESHRAFRDPYANLQVAELETLPADAATITEEVGAVPATVEESSQADLRPPFETWAIESKNAYVTGATSARRVPLDGSARRGRCATPQPISRTLGSQERITARLDRERRAMGMCAPHSIIVPSADAAHAAAVAARRLVPPRRAVRLPNAPARSNSGATTRSGLTSARVAQQRGPLQRSLTLKRATKDAVCQTETTMDDLIALAAREGPIYATDLSACPTCGKIYRGGAGIDSDRLTCSAPPLRCRHCTGNIALVRLLVTVPLPGSRMHSRQLAAAPTDAIPPGASSDPAAVPRSVSRRSQSPAFSSEGTKQCLTWCL